MIAISLLLVMLVIIVPEILVSVEAVEVNDDLLQPSVFDVNSADVIVRCPSAPYIAVVIYANRPP